MIMTKEREAEYTVSLQLHFKSITWNAYWPEFGTMKKKKIGYNHISQMENEHQGKATIALTLHNIYFN